MKKDCEFDGGKSSSLSLILRPPEPIAGQIVRRNISEHKLLLENAAHMIV